MRDFNLFRKGLKYMHTKSVPLSRRNCSDPVISFQEVAQPPEALATFSAARDELMMRQHLVLTSYKNKSRHKLDI
jgi:hypothetical protein